MRPLPLLLLFACTANKDLPEETGDSDETGGPDSEDTQESGETEETEDTVDTQETGETGDTEESDTQETGETDTGIDTRVLSITLAPEEMSINPGGTYVLEASVRYSNGTFDSGETMTWTTDDTAVATVDSTGLVTGIGPGTTRIHVGDGFSEATATVRVTADVAFYVTVVSALDGTPVEGAEVLVDGGDSAFTDKAGYAEVAAPSAGPETITALVSADWSAVTYLDVSSRVLTIPLLPKDAVTTGTLQGTVDFSGVPDADATELVVGLVPHTVQGSLATLLLQDLFGPDQTVSIYGNDVDIPANVLLEGTVDSYSIPCEPGDVGAWGFAGPVSIRDVSSAAGGAGAALQLLLDNLGNMTWGYTGGGVASVGATTTLDLAPATAFSTTETVPLPALPSGFHGDEELLVFLADECAAEGWFVTGMGSGTTEAEVSAVPAGTVSCGTRSAAYVYAEVGGFGSGGASSTAQGGVDRSGTWNIPELQDAPGVDGWDPATRALAFTVDSDASFVRVRMVDDRYNVHDYYAATSWTGIVPADFSEFRRPSADIEIWALDLTAGSFEEKVAAGDLDGREFSVSTAARSNEVH